jgi:hypothetical protein
VVGLNHSDYATVNVMAGASIIAPGGANLTAPVMLAAPITGGFNELAGSPTIDTGINEVANGARVALQRLGDRRSRANPVSAPSPHILISRAGESDPTAWPTGIVCGG